MTEKEMIMLVRAGDHMAYTALYRKYFVKVCNFCRLYMSNSSVVEDIVQDVFVKIWDKRMFLREDSADLEGFIFVVTRNVLFDMYRKKINEELYAIDAIDVVSNENVEASVEASNLLSRIDELVDRMPDIKRRIFKMSRNKYKTNIEIAKELNISKKTVESNLSAVIKFLRKNTAIFSFIL